MKHTNVFSNRVLNLRKITCLGLDMDHTLIRYHTEQFEALVYKHVVNKLIEVKDYPAQLKELCFQFNAAIRGLVIDKHHGNILKLSRHGAIKRSYHGTHEISFTKQAKLYKSLYLDLKDENYLVIDTAFSIAFCSLYAQLIDLKDKEPQAFPSYFDIADDLLYCHDLVHKNGELKAYVKQNLSQFIIQDPLIVEGLKRFKQHDKKVFILTNSEFDYTKSLLDFAISPFLDEGQTWQDLFDYVICFADKPRFFYDNLKFLRIDPDSGSMHNSTAPLTPGIYQGGCAKQFTDDLALSGDEILYIGDHIYGDIVKLKKECYWRTALVVEELAHELEAQQQSKSLMKQIKHLMDEKIPLEQQLTDLFSCLVEKTCETSQQEIHSIQDKINELDVKVTFLIQQKMAIYNPYWGSIFRAGSEESYFASQADRFACIYMAKLTDLFAYSPRHYFQASYRPLSHEIE